MKIENVQYTTRQKLRVMTATINDLPAVFYPDLKRTLLDQGVVFLGSEFEDSARVRLAARPDLGQPEIELYGFSDDPELVALVRAYIERLDNEPPKAGGGWF